MRFKAVIKDPKSFVGICNTNKSLHKRCIIKLDAAKTRFLTNSGAVDGTHIWTTVRTESVFSEFRIESTLDNNIYVDVFDITNLVAALRAAEKCSGHAIIKLTKDENNALQHLLRLNIQNPATGQDIVHNIPVHVLGYQEIDAIPAPPLESRMTQIVLPNCLNELAYFVEKAKASACQSVRVTVQEAPPHLGGDGDANGAAGAGLRNNANGGGSSNLLHFTAETTSAAFAVTFPNVTVQMSGRPTPEEQQQQQQDKNNNDNRSRNGAAAAGAAAAAAAADDGITSVAVDTKKLHRFFAIRDTLSPVHIIMSLVGNRALVFSAFAVHETNLVFYIPGMFV